MYIQWENEMIVSVLETSSSSKAVTLSGLENLQASRSQEDSQFKATEIGTLQSHSTQPLGV